MSDFERYKDKIKNLDADIKADKLQKENFELQRKMELAQAEQQRLQIATETAKSILEVSNLPDLLQRVNREYLNGRGKIQTHTRTDHQHTTTESFQSDGHGPMSLSERFYPTFYEIDYLLQYESNPKFLLLSMLRSSVQDDTSSTKLKFRSTNKDDWKKRGWDNDLWWWDSWTVGLMGEIRLVESESSYQSSCDDIADILSLKDKTEKFVCKYVFDEFRWHKK